MRAVHSGHCEPASEARLCAGPTFPRRSPVLPSNPTTYAVLAVFHGVLATVCVGHILLTKRDPRSALGWVAISLAYPFAGPLLYAVFGINRVHTRARALLPEDLRREPDGDDGHAVPDESFVVLDRIARSVTGKPLLSGNRVRPLFNGEQAYPRMLEAIERATTCVYLGTYIWETNATGQQFVEALARARERGVTVRALVDGVGELYSWPRVTGLLRRHSVPAARFLPPRLLPPSFYVNLRNHRKILCVDGVVAFVGGMNIGDRHLADDPENRQPVIDLHFEVRGPVVFQIERAFLEDWAFTTGERRFTTEVARQPLEDSMSCRVICDGPNEDLDKLPAVINGAIAAASERVIVMTPYFLPSPDLTSVLQAAALRGVDVSIVLPGTNNLFMVHWAAFHGLEALLARGVRVFFQPPPFVHSKLLIVDHYYVQVGSANLDPRSLRLNFELALEVYDGHFAERLEAHAREAIARSTEFTLDDLNARPLWRRLRDALFWLGSPYM